MKKQINLMLTAVMFYTRIPVPHSLPYTEDMLNRSTRYFPLIGWIVGGIGACVFYGLSFIFPKDISVFLSIISTLLVTGAFHEDGFADFCDGFGGGMTKDRIFSIMKDSRIGTYGTVALISILGAKFICLNSFPLLVIPVVLWAAHSFSRIMPVIIIFTSFYSIQDLQSKVKPIGKRGKRSDFVIAVFFGLFPMVFTPWQFIVLIVPLSLLITYLFKRYIEHKINGYTGDCLGALQQIVEIVFYLCLLVVS